MANIDWKPIETAPHDDTRYLLGFDEVTAELHGNRQAGLCIIRWVEPDPEYDDWGDEWEVSPFAEGLDVVTSESKITWWAELPSVPEAS